MGWLISNDPNFGRKEQVAEILNSYKHNRYPYSTLVDHSQRGNTLYMVLHNPTRRPANGVEIDRRDQAIDLSALSFDLCGNYRFIAVYLLSGPKRGEEGGWGYKSMDESAGPGVNDCPERLLKQSQMDDRYDWRKGCREVRRLAKVRREWAKGLKAGDTVLYPAGLEIVDGKYVSKMRRITFLRDYSKTYFVGQGEKGVLRFRWDRVEFPEAVRAAA
ncbi:hypothetical protein VRRI112168_02705 [Vreelandella rituensis]|uniref:Uncharacterized protein n=1 Tax=Vreelandella rituensis TaxID=2282306 RepID=A0A368U9P6_9GAMM|nr:hypothetical protein [Halomonas rituensis]RCV93654.1 hypothetical protein DU506_00425 [Halomonas rituensis]